MVFLNRILRLFSLGTSSNHPEWLNKKVYLSNQLAVLLFLFFGPFSLISGYYFPPIVVIISWTGVVLCLVTPLLNYFGHVNLSRLWLCLIPLTTATLYKAYTMTPGEPVWGKGWGLHYIFIYTPLLIFDLRERVKLGSMLGVVALVLFLEAPLNNWFVLPEPVDVGFWKFGWFGYATLTITIAVTVTTVLMQIYRSEVAEKKARELLMKNYEYVLAHAELKALRSQFNPHFIFNALASIQQYVLKNDRIKANQYLTRFSKLIRLILNHSDQLKISLAEEFQALQYYLEIEQLRMSDRFEFAFESDSDVALEEIEVPSMLFQIFAENAIWHGLAPLESGGKLTIKTFREGDDVVIHLDDNGIGREASAKGKVKWDHQSKGLKMTEDKIHLFNLNREAPLTMAVEDLKDDLGAAAGTRVIVRIPQK